jgi:hypothetical protein
MTRPRKPLTPEQREKAKLACRRWYAKNRVKQLGQRRAQSQKNKENREWRKANPEKFRAHVAVGNALAKGKLIRPERCQLCWEPSRIEAHHQDYSKVLDVVWLCHSCHRYVEGRQFKNPAV